MRKISGLQPTPRLRLLRFVCLAAKEQERPDRKNVAGTLQTRYRFGRAKARDYVSLARKMDLLTSSFVLTGTGRRLLELPSLPDEDQRLSLSEKRFFLEVLLKKDDECVIPLIRSVHREPRLDRLRDIFCEEVGFGRLRQGAREVKTVVRLRWLEDLTLVESRRNRVVLTDHGVEFLRLIKREALEGIPSMLYGRVEDRRVATQERIPLVYDRLGETILAYFREAEKKALEDKTGRLLEGFLIDGYLLIGFSVKALGSERTGKKVPDAIVQLVENGSLKVQLVNDAKNVIEYSMPTSDLRRMKKYCDYAHGVTPKSKIYGVFFAPGFSKTAELHAKKLSDESVAEKILLLTVGGFRSLVELLWRRREQGRVLPLATVVALLKDAPDTIDEAYINKEIDTLVEYE